MRRLLLCLPLCCLLAPAQVEPLPRPPATPAVAPVADDKKPDLPDRLAMEKLARDNPVAFLENCIRYYDRQVTDGFSATFAKHERIEGELKKPEVIEVHYRNQPHSVYFRWVEGAGLARRTVYVDGANNNRAQVLTAFGGIRDVDPEGDLARRSGRYTLKQFGIRKGMVRALDSWKAAQQRKQLHVEFLGEEKVKEAGDRVCYKLQRARYDKPEGDGVTDLTVYIDKETFLQVGTVLRDANGKLIGEYYFRDLRLNPTFKEGQFTRNALRP